MATAVITSIDYNIVPRYTLYDTYVYMYTRTYYTQHQVLVLDLVPILAIAGG